MTNQLYDAVLREDIDEVKLLIKNGADQHITNHNSNNNVSCYNPKFRNSSISN